VAGAAAESTPATIEPPEATGSVVSQAGASIAASAAENLARLDELAVSMSLALRTYGSVTARHALQQQTCADVQAAYVALDDAWFEYNVSGMSQLSSNLDLERSRRHDSLYDEMQTAEGSFNQSGCPRP
jgi:hypothetical protein